MDSIKSLLKTGTEAEKQAFFKSEAVKMWDCKYLGDKRSIPLNFEALYRWGMTEKHIKKLKKYFKDDDGKFVNNASYYYYQKGEITRIFLEESNGSFDWKQNFMAFSIKVKIGDTYRRYHLGFFATALTVFLDMQKTGLLNDNAIIDLFGYSHGAGAAPSLYSLIFHNSKSLIIENVKKFEPPRDIYQPRTAVKKECSEHFNFIQGNDIVTKVPWWMSSPGLKIKIKGRKLSFIKNLLPQVFDHDIYWTDNRR